MLSNHDVLTKMMAVKSPRELIVFLSYERVFFIVYDAPLRPTRGCVKRSPQKGGSRKSRSLLRLNGQSCSVKLTEIRDY